MTSNSKEHDNDKDDDGEPHMCVVAAQATKMKVPSRQRGNRATTTTSASRRYIYERHTELNL